MTQKFIFFNNFRVLKQVEDETRKSSQGLDKNFSDMNENLNNLEEKLSKKTEILKKNQNKTNVGN